MKHINYYLSLVILFFCEFGYSQVQCTLDVTILEGANITMCADAPNSLSALSGFVAYNWSGPEILSGQTVTPQFSGVYTVAATDALNCISTASILVTVNPSPTPIIISSEGNLICPSVGTTLSTTNSYSSYNWSNGSTASTNFITAPNTYTVTVTDANNCIGQNTILINTFTFDLSVLPTSSCIGKTLTLNASGGTSYAWSTGEFGPTIIVNPTAPTNFSVEITAGACLETKTILVQPIEVADFDLDDTIYVRLNEDYYISGPEGYSSYVWTPIDQIDSPFSQGVTFSGTESQTLFINATHPSGCTISDSVVMIVVDLHIPNGFSPNGDIYNQFFVIPELETENLTAKTSIWNRWGELVVETNEYKNNWEGECMTDLCLGSRSLPEGTYFYHIDVHGVTFKGYVTLKR